ncbi:MAG: nickel-type superoxide dismutase maturation protease [Actinomycetota bacterium]
MTDRSDRAGRRPSIVRETLAWVVGRRRRIRVVGESMTPTLVPGQFVLVDPARTPVAGELALARHPTQARLLVVKRVGTVGGDGRFELASDNPEAGTDSRTWGPVEAELIQGTVTLLLDRPTAELGRP